MDGELARRYLSDMAPLRDISQAMGVSWSSAKNRAHILGLRRDPTWTPRSRAVVLRWRIPCLSCGDGFFSTDPRRLRVCSTCKRRDGWRNGPCVED